MLANGRSRNACYLVADVAASLYLVLLASLRSIYLLPNNKKIKILSIFFVWSFYDLTSPVTNVHVFIYSSKSGKDLRKLNRIQQNRRTRQGHSTEES